MKKIALFIFYFGKFPNYFPIFLNSCAQNPELTWKIYTDNLKCGEWPHNVEHHYMTFQQCREHFQKKFSFQIRLDSPKKLCDYRPAYGYIMEEELTGYDFWGHCDIDMIFGNVRRFLTDELLNTYDKLYTLGQFTLYRNVPECNYYFMTFDGGNRSREVFQNPDLVAFDEWSSGNINEIFHNSELQFYEKAFGADVWPERTRFYLSEYFSERDRYKMIPGSEGSLSGVKRDCFIFLMTING